MSLFFRVICGTQEVLSSALPFLPSKKASSGSSDSDFDFGSANSLPDIVDPPMRESPVPGLVRLQREILENRGTGRQLPPVDPRINPLQTSKQLPVDSRINPLQVSKQLPVDSRLLDNRGTSKQLPVDLRINPLQTSKQSSLDSRILENRGPPADSSIKPESVVPLVTSEAGPGCEDLKDSGIVKRLKMELEAKSTGAGLPESSSPPEEAHKRLPEESHGLHRDRQGKRCPELREEAQTRPEEAHWVGGGDPLKRAPPTPHRKASLDLSFVQRKLRLGQPAPVIRPAFGIPPADPRVAEIPPAGLARKLRKQQGSSHPLSKLIKQRHPNPLYNTM